MGLFLFPIDCFLENMCGQNIIQQNYCLVYVVIRHLQRLQVYLVLFTGDKERPKPKYSLSA